MHSNWRMLEWGGFPGDTGTCRIAWKGWKVMNDWNVWSDWNVWNVFGRSWKTHGWISRRSPCLLYIEFLSGMKVSLPSVCSSSSSSSSSTQRALCLLHVELDSGWRILWI